MKKYYIKLFLAIIVLAIIAIIVSKPLYTSRKADTASNSQLEIKAQEEIKIRKGSTSLYLIKAKEHVWETNDEDALKINMTMLNKLMKTINGFKYHEIISENPQKYEYFNVTDETAFVFCTFKHSQLTSKFYIGKHNPQYNSTFIRKEKQPQVFQENGELADSFQPERQRWIENTIPLIDEPSINRITIKFPDKKIVYEKTTSNNWLAENHKSYTKQATKLLETFHNLVVEKQVPRKEIKKMLPKHETYSIDFGQTNQKSTTYMIYLLDDYGVYLKDQKESYIYKVDKQAIYPISSSNYYEGL
ncbi:MAG: hypothetical protein DKM50_11840 [Candidatus Margulisiibacteriota bacterium]|nr:MAG: hypothetical protein A2X43_04735 [Candidatus Margulisbacteria bacterium GWD2_39_127]OGI01551.1 MAG: hypothetical protein A2X42_08215 [Candidatus Margulisbacteria bacterium GWF2_38_17]OGI09992.1 MAG: hypothetical protein A2X41_08925 [Candidatus Margulisbacteria bacterium GWE2_39_32]PZM78246.1 MAG: hypothetical protein DKM50_11840 [Candidatus Margulisiibacteriota bacterium]HAR61867.1 hypothetical protein [Candidatus Margulisiibacteriota bacterium]